MAVNCITRSSASAATANGQLGDLRGGAFYSFGRQIDDRITRLDTRVHTISRINPMEAYPSNYMVS